VSAALQGAALLTTALGLLSAAAVLARGRKGLPAVHVLLDFLLAAGLLRLADNPGWREIAVAATVVALRRLLAYDLRPR
jgi:uncharacterized membrane protein